MGYIINNSHRTETTRVEKTKELEKKDIDRYVQFRNFISITFRRAQK